MIADVFMYLYVLYLALHWQIGWGQQNFQRAKYKIKKLTFLKVSRLCVIVATLCPAL